MQVMYKVTIYRNDSVTKVEYSNVKHTFWNADNTVLTLAILTGNGGNHYYVSWLREHFVWFKTERETGVNITVTCEGVPCK